MNESRRRPAKRKTARKNGLCACLAAFGASGRPVLLAAGTFTTAVLILTASVGFGVRHADASGGQVMKITTPGGGTTFYVGRCFRTDFKLQTDSLNANSIDIVLPYNPTYLAPYTGSGCVTAATAINTNGLFPSYPSNTIAGNTVQVTGYDPSGSSPANTGVGPADRVVGHLFWKVLAASGAYNLNYTFTLGSTIDTNMAEAGGDGSDALDSVQNLTLNLSADAGAPTFTSQSPSNGATGVSVTSGVSYSFNDAESGVGTGSLTTKMNWVSRSMTFSACTRTNSNRIPACTVTLTGLGTLSYNTLYKVSATGSDVASPTPNQGTGYWSFTTEDDTSPPYLSNISPSSGATGVAVNSNISFHVKDYKAQAGVTPGLGVDISTVSVAVTEAGGSTTTYTSASPQFSYTGTSADYTVTINPSSDFNQNKVVSVVINASDLHTPSPNAMTPVSYSFTTVDSTAPTFGSFVPAQSASDVAADSNVSFHVLDGAGGAGVDIANTSVTVNGTTYTSASPQFSYTGTSADYAITINPSANFSGGQTVTVAISTRDLASTPNTASTSYTFSIASVCNTCSVDSESPARFTTSAALTNTISFHVKDTGDGILSSSITVVLIGTGAAFTSSPLTLTGASPLVSITGTSADYTVTITLPAALEQNSPASVMIDATNVNGLAMASVGYTIAAISGGTTTVTSACTSSDTSGTQTRTGGGNRDRSDILGSLVSSDLPIIVARRQLPDNTVVERELTQAEAESVRMCFVDADSLHAAATPYEDIKPGDWYEDAVHRFLELGILDASKTTFRGTDSALRAEFAKVLAVLGKDTPVTPAIPSFDDVRPGTWYFTFIETVAKRSIMKGYGECYGTHPCQAMPGSVITRAEAAAMAVRFYGLTPSGKAPRFSDIGPDAWYETVVQTAADHCILQGKGSSALQFTRPNSPVTRAEMVTMLDRASRGLLYGKDCAWGPDALHAQAEAEAMAYAETHTVPVSAPLTALSMIGSIAGMAFVFGRRII